MSAGIEEDSDICEDSRFEKFVKIGRELLVIVSRVQNAAQRDLSHIACGGGNFGGTTVARSRKK